MNIKEAQELADNKINTKVLNIETIDLGADSKTYRIITQKENYILRTGGKRSNYDVEHAILRILLTKNVKVPVPVSEFIDSNDPDLSYSLQEELPGEDLFRNGMAESLWPRLLEQVGENMRRVYAFELFGFGPISTEKFRSNGELVGSFNSYEQFVNYYFDSRVEKFIEKVHQDEANNFKNSNLNKRQIEKVLEIINRLPEVTERMQNYLSNFLPEGKLVHGDFHPQHILIDKGNLTGIIDFNNTLIAEPLFDIAYWSIMPRGKYYKELAKRAGVKIDKERFSLYRLVISIAKLHTRYVTFNYLAQYPEILDFALDELNK